MGEQVLASRKRVLPPDHPDIARAMVKVAGFHFYLGRHATTLQMREQVPAFLRRVLPAEHPDIARSIGNLSAIYRDVGRHAEAVEKGEQALSFLQRVFSDDHPEVAKTMGNLAICYRDRGWLSEALEMGEKALGIRRGVPACASHDPHGISVPTKFPTKYVLRSIAFVLTARSLVVKFELFINSIFGSYSF
jgi:hypothetical protein